MRCPTSAARSRRAQLAQWQAWAAEAEPCFRLIRQGLQLVGGMGELGDPNMMKRLLIAGQVTTTVWRLLHANGDWADRTRTLLNQLTGRPVRPDRPLIGQRARTWAWASSSCCWRRWAPSRRPTEPWLCAG